MNILFVPIKKEPKEKWLRKKGKYSDITVEEIIKKYAENIYRWIEIEKDIYINYSVKKIYDDIVDILYKNEYKRVNLDNELYDLYSLKYNEDIYKIHKTYLDMICLDIGNNIMIL